MALAWTKYWAPSDDGRTLKAVDLRNVQDDIDAYITVNPTAGTVLTTTDQTISGTKTFSSSPVVPAAFWAAVYPVGSSYINFTNSANPATLFGFGTWVAVEGVVIAGYKAGDANFGTAGATIGAATHTLSIDEMPAHTHSAGATARNATSNDAGGYAQVGTTGSTGGGLAHNNIQPTLVAYCWKRTA